jgi:hypothetical protein
VRVAVDLVHNWEGGNVHPFVGAGIGAYFLQRRNAGQNFGESETKLGGTLLGGVEIFTGPTLRHQSRGTVSHRAAHLRALDPDGFAFTVGVKTYF